MRTMQLRGVRYIGLDVHRATIAVAIAEEVRRAATARWPTIRLSSWIGELQKFPTVERFPCQPVLSANCDGCRKLPLREGAGSDTDPSAAACSSTQPFSISLPPLGCATHHRA